MRTQPSIAALSGLAALLFLPCAALPAETTEARRTAERTVQALTRAFRAHDGRAFAAEFWPDAEFMNVFGQVVTGEEQIRTLHDTVFKGALSQRVVRMDIRSVRPLAPNVIVVDTTDSDESTVEHPNRDRVTRLKLILERRGQIWRIVAAQNTPVTTPPFATGAPAQ